MGRKYAGILGPLAFATVLFRGLVLADGLDPTLKLAMLSLFSFAALGFLIGRIAEATVLESVKSRFDLEMQKQAEQTATPTTG